MHACTYVCGAANKYACTYMRGANKYACIHAKRSGEAKRYMHAFVRCGKQVDMHVQFGADKYACI